jgi:hypothetical protein
MTPIKVIEKPTLVDFWKEQNDKAEETKLVEAALELQILAESDLHAMYKEVKDSEKNLRKAKVDAQNEADFKSIANLALKVKTSSKILSEALEVYRELFGEEPKFGFKL